MACAREELVALSAFVVMVLNRDEGYRFELQKYQERGHMSHEILHCLTICEKGLLWDGCRLKTGCGQTSKMQSTWEAEAGGSGVQGQPGQRSETPLPSKKIESDFYYIYCMTQQSTSRYLSKRNDNISIRKLHENVYNQNWKQPKVHQLVKKQNCGTCIQWNST
jgi:hypothetical protein